MTETMRQLLSRSRDQLDALFRTGEAGPIPDGTAEGILLIAPGTILARPVAALARSILWRGKRFDAKRGALMNRLLPFGIEAMRATVAIAPSRLDGRPCIVLDYARTSFVARRVRDEIRLIAPDLYLGRAYWRGRWLLDFALEFRPRSG